MYTFMRWFVGLALGFYFRRIERFHQDRVPKSGPVLFVSNHPNSLTDSFVIGAAVPRKVNFVATVQLFRIAPLKWLFSRCGVIPINRVKDDPKAMRTVADTFAACYKVLEAGEAVGIFPEGITYEDSQLKEVKSGAARMALELEHRHGGKLGLQVVPVGLTYSAKEIYRSDVLANFGEPIRAADFLEGYAERRRECIQRLTSEIETRIQSLISHLPKLEHERLIAGVKRLYLEALRAGNKTIGAAVLSGAEELQVTQKIIETVEAVYGEQPERAAIFAAKLDLYERTLRRFSLREDPIEQPGAESKAWARSLKNGLIALLGAPFALYGWVHRIVPFALVRWGKAHLTEPGRPKAQASTAAIAGGIVAFGICYSVYIFAFHALIGWPASLWYALSLPVASLVAYYYLREIHRLGGSLWNLILLFRAPASMRRLVALRTELVKEIEAVAKENREKRATSVLNASTGS